jgi:hypothetical protein
MNAPRRFDTVRAPELADVLGLLADARDDERIEAGRRRMAAVSGGQPCGYLPLAIDGGVDRGGLPRYSMRDQFYNREPMLVEQLWGALAAARSGSDLQPTVRPQLGVGFAATLVGIESIIIEDNMPWPHGHLSLEQIDALALPDDLAELPGLRRGLELLQFYRQTVGELCGIFIPDTQGPFDVAHLIRGHDLLTDLYERPQFVHRLMATATRIWIGIVEACKQGIGEPFGACYHSGRYLSVGQRACFDTDTLLGPAHLAEFVEPYVRRAAQAVGGIWAHYCGANAHLARMLIERIEQVRGLNLGNPEMHDPRAYMADVLANDKFFVGVWAPGRPDPEPVLRDVLGTLNGQRRGLILHLHRPRGADGQWAADTMATWHRLQDEMLESPA